MIDVLFYLVGLIIVVFGTIHLTRLTLFSIGSHIYEVVQRGRKNIAARRMPTFTILIPAHNERHSIISCLESVVHATYDKNKRQIIVADDGSTDTTARLVREYQKTHPHENIILVSRANEGKAHALNHVIKHFAEGELVMCLDADSQIHPQALMRASAYFFDARVVALSSNVKIIPTGRLLNLVQLYEYVVNYHIKRALTTYNIEYIIGGIGSVFRHSALSKVGYYDTDTITEDIDLTMKLLRLGNRQNRVIYGADVITYTQAALSLSDLIRQRFRWKYGRLQTFIKNSDLFFSTDSRHAKQLTWLYLPFILLGEIIFFSEPLAVTFLLLLAIMFGDWITISSACAIMSSFVIFSILAEDTLSWSTKVKLTIAAPAMYIFFYILNAVEYIALVRTYFRFGAVRRSIKNNECRWEHVERVRIV